MESHRLPARLLGLVLACAAMRLHAAEFDVRTYGAAGDGKTIDTAAINKAIDAAVAAGGGTVRFPAGTYASYSIHLKSHVALALDAGSTILAADPPADLSAGYDAPEPNAVTDQYEDFGHSHWHNSLIWGENLVDISITGPGRIFGYGLSRGRPFVRRDTLPEERASATPPDLALPAADVDAIKAMKPAPFGYPGKDTLPAGVGNKAIALKNCRNVIFRDFTIYHGGHFGILATGVDNWTCDNLKIDTNRDGIDFDCCQNVRVSDCTVNSPNDDGICPKSSYSLGCNRVTENVTITNCQVSGYVEGTLLDGTRRHGDSRDLAATARPGASSAARSPTGASATSPYQTACSSTAAAWPSSPSTARSWRTSRSRTSPCATSSTRPSSSAWAPACAGPRARTWEPPGA